MAWGEAKHHILSPRMFELLRGLMSPGKRHQPQITLEGRTLVHGEIDESEISDELQRLLPDIELKHGL